MEILEQVEGRENIGNRLVNADRDFGDFGFESGLVLENETSFDSFNLLHQKYNQKKLIPSTFLLFQLFIYPFFLSNPNLLSFFIFPYFKLQTYMGCTSSRNQPPLK